jgi:hypothetical protein
MYIYICIYVYVYIYIWIYVFMYICIYIGALWEQSDGVIYLIKENTPYIIDMYVYTDICI